MKFFVRFYKRKVKRRRVRAKISAKSRVDYVENKTTVLNLCQNRLLHFNEHYKFKIGTVRVRNQKTRWGSCSSKGNLSFNYKIVHLPAHLADYIVVHELCHIGQFNHSEDFWKLVGETIPDYMKLRDELKKVRIK